LPTGATLLQTFIMSIMVHDRIMVGYDRSVK
jgi:hypothetical protein